MNIYTKALLLLFAFTILSCDKEYNTIGSDIIGDEHFDFKKYPVENLVSYLKETGPVQSNNLPINALGIYKDPVFGTTKAHFVSQIEMKTADPSVGYEPYIDSVKDSVYIYIPFFSTEVSTTDDGGKIYKLDSIHGDGEAKFNLKVYENGYYLRDFDPNDNNQAQKYYSDFKSTIDTYKGILLNDNGNTSENTDFFFDKKEIIIYKTDGSGHEVDSSGEPTSDPNQYVVKERKKPGIWLNLNKAFFETKILGGVANGKLLNNNVFKQYFKGLFFEVEEIMTGQGSMVNLDLTKAELVMQYHYYAALDDNNVPIDLKESSISFQMGYSTSTSQKSNSINLFEFSNIETNYQDALSGSDPEGRLYLKGGAKSSTVYLDIFDDNELASLREKKWLINEANIVFYIDQSKMSNAQYEPLRIYLYDATNNKPLLDYYTDPTSGSNSKLNKYIFGGIISKDESGKGVKYKMRITDYINNVLNGTDNNENVRLGLVVDESINLVGNASLKTPFTLNNQEIKFLPVTSVINHLGTVLHGPNSSATYIDDNGNEISMKLKLEIYYTEPN